MMMRRSRIRRRGGGVRARKGEIKSEIEDADVSDNMYGSVVPV